MKIFEPMYNKTLAWAGHRSAERYLGVVSFAESSFFPIPTAFMLAPMVLAKPQRAWWLALLATLTSVAGGLFGYVIGYFLFDQVGQLIIESLGKAEAFEAIKARFLKDGVWLVLLAGVTPLPYKLCTITSGLLGLAIIPFTIASLIGRAGQFFIIAGVLKWGGPKIETHLRRWMEILGWLFIGLAVAAYVYFRT
ncbi:MAG: DedA family protein [Granulosicoccus sp.]|nr:DedA family protein [Granulosicoccus sp.]